MTTESRPLDKDMQRLLRRGVAEIIVESLRSLDPRYPAVSDEQKKDFAGMSKRLERE